MIKEIEKYYKEHKGKSLYFYPLAVLYHQQKENDKAYKILLDGLQYYPRYVLALIKIAEILIEDRKYEVALAYLETASSIQKYNTKALKYLALAYEKLNRYEDALEVYKKIISIDYNDEEAKSKIVELAPMVKPDTEEIDSLVENISDEGTVEKGKQKDDTYTAYDSIFSTDKPDDEIKTDNNSISIEDIPEVSLEEKDNKEQEEVASVTLARLYEKQGYIEDAINVYKKILEKEPDNMEVLESLSKLEELEKKR